MAIPVAQYLRMSTEHQRYSIARQGAAIADYAAAHGYDVVRTYADEGVSGLQVEKREGLRRLLADVLGGRAPFSLILVYDVSRWGRFQDPDQSAHYEFICRDAGVQVEYCAEPFTNDGTLSASLMKSLKRIMAAEYSRELSDKVGRSKGRAAALGFWVSGPSGFGLRRQVIYPDGRAGRILQRGELKEQNTRARLVPGPPEEVATVLRIYRLFVIGGLGLAGIAELLNSEGTFSEGGARWTKRRIRSILSNEKYAGALIYGRTHQPFNGHMQTVPQEDWLRLPNTFEPVVDAAMFAAANRNLRRKSRRARVDDATMLDNLRQLLAEQGRLSAGIIDDSPLTHSAESYKLRFGTLLKAYALIDWRPSERQIAAAELIRRRHPHLERIFDAPWTDEALLSALAAVYAERGRLSVNLIELDRRTPEAFRYRVRFGSLRLAYALVGYSPTFQQARLMDSICQPGVSAELALAIAKAAPRGGYLTPADLPALGLALPAGPPPPRRRSQRRRPVLVSVPEPPG